MVFTNMDDFVVTMHGNAFILCEGDIVGNDGDAVNDGSTWNLKVAVLQCYGLDCVTGSTSKPLWSLVRVKLSYQAV